VEQGNKKAQVAGPKPLKLMGPCKWLERAHHFTGKNTKKTWQLWMTRHDEQIMDTWLA
jgi:hypothetical protein